MTGHPIDIAGIEIPSSAPAFLGVVAVHFVAALGATVAGVWAMLERKGHGRHPRAGSTYYWLLAMVAITMAALAGMRWAEDKSLFALGIFSIASASLGRMALRRRWRGYLSVHIVGMSCSYILMLTAFYVDNGRNLPLWRRLPTAAYWLLPAMIGTPLIIRGLRKYRGLML